MGRKALSINRQRLKPGLILGSIIAGIIVIISVCDEARWLNFNVDIGVFLIGPAIFTGGITKSYLINSFIVYLSTFIYYIAVCIFICNVSKIKKIIIALCLILLHILSVVLFSNMFNFYFTLEP